LQQIPEIKCRFTPILFRELLKTSVSLDDKRKKEINMNEHLQKKSIKVWRNLGELSCLGSA
jgi:hypothetical protein